MDVNFQRWRAQTACAILEPVTSPDGSEPWQVVTGMADGRPAHSAGPAEALIRSLVKSALFDGEGGAVGPYRVRKKLGEGALGVVFEAHDPKLDRAVALKLLHAPEHQGSLTREAQVIARLSHPNIIHIYDVGEYEGHVYIAMELVQGQSLRRWVPGRSTSEIVGAFLQAARGLAAAHDAGIVHRDFKPDNALVNRQGRVFVVDFGVARDVRELADASTAGRSVLETLTRPGGHIGTPAYMAPEQFAGRPADPRTDVFALCVSLFEALHGIRPFAGDSVPELAAAVSGGRREPPTRPIPRSLAAALDRGLQLDPEHRFQTMDDLVAALERVQGRRRSWLGGVGVAMVAAAVGAVAFAAGDRDTARSPRADAVVEQIEPAEASPAAPSEAPPERGLVDHYVLPGEMLAEVAALYEADPADLVQLNRLPGPDAALEPGNTIRVRAAKPVDRRLVVHEVLGETSWASLAVRYDVAEERLRLYNPTLGDTLEDGDAVTVYVTVTPAEGEGSAGAQSIGKVSDGRLRVGTKLPASKTYTRNVPTLLWGSSFTVGHLTAALAGFRADSGYSGPLVVGDMSKRGGGPLPPHRSHQSGRDVDLFLPVVPGVDLRQKGQALRKPALSEVDWVAVARLCRALLDTGAVEYIFLDWEMQPLLHKGAALAGWPEKDLHRLIHWPEKNDPHAVIRHSSGHTTEIHVRFKCGPDEADCLGPRARPGPR